MVGLALAAETQPEAVGGDQAAGTSGTPGPSQCSSLRLPSPLPLFSGSSHTGLLSVPQTPWATEQLGSSSQNPFLPWEPLVILQGSAESSLPLRVVTWLPRWTGVPDVLICSSPVPALSSQHTLAVGAVCVCVVSVAPGSLGGLL